MIFAKELTDARALFLACLNRDNLDIFIFFLMESSRLCQKWLVVYGLEVFALFKFSQYLHSLEAMRMWTGVSPGSDSE